MDKSAIRDAATVILWRTGQNGAEVLMGQRGSKAVFMPDKFVFPGGAIDSDDAAIRLSHQPDPTCLRRLGVETPAHRINALLAGGIREVWEETGLLLGTPGPWEDAPADWAAFAARGLVPSAERFRYVFRAVTPPGRTRRFDARFFLVPATAVVGDADDFSLASDELRHLQWIALGEIRQFDLPFITQLVLGELAPLLSDDQQQGPPATVPFVKNDDMVSGVTRIT